MQESAQVSELHASTLEQAHQAELDIISDRLQAVQQHLDLNIQQAQTAAQAWQETADLVSLHHHNSVKSLELRLANAQVHFVQQHLQDTGTMPS